MRISKVLAVSALALVLAAVVNQTAGAADEPTVAWTSPANNSTLTGKIALKATATPASSGTATISKWCLTINGDEATNYGAATFIRNDGYELSYDYYGRSGGCWSSTSYDSRKITLSYDTTSMENKAYTLVLKVTDSSGRESAAASLTFTTANVGPTVAWTSPANNSTLTGKIALKATATPASSGTATISKWCLTINGDEATNYGAATFIRNDGYELSYDYYGRSGGCWSSTSYDSRKITLSYDTTSMENKAYTLVLKVTDSSGRESAAASLTFTTANVGPTVAWTSPANNSTLTGKIALKATATPASSGTAAISKWCLTINGDEATNYGAATFIRNDGYELSYDYYGRSGGCWSSTSYDSRKITLSYDTTSMENKAYTLVLKVTDSSGRESAAASLTFTTANVGPTVAWTSPANNSTLTGKIALKATATPASSGTATISKWCLTINGDEATNYGAATFIRNDGYELSYDYYGRSGGCWSSTSYDSRKITLSYDTTAWENKAYTFVLKVTDSTGRESGEAKWTINTNNPGPTITGTSSNGTSETRPSVTLTAKRNGDAEITKWCLNFPQEANIEVLPKFLDSYGVELESDSYEYEGNCFIPDSEVLKASFYIVTEAAKNGKYSFEFWAYDENNHISEKYKFDYTLADPGLKISLPDSGTLYLPADFPTVLVDQQGGYRSIELVQWSIDGKTIPGSSTTLDASLSEVSPGAHTVSVKVIDSIGNSYSATKSYTMKWAPVIKFSGLDGYYWYTPATPTIKVRAYLGSTTWSGSHAATITYKNASGKTVKQAFTIKNGTASVVLQTLKVTTNIKVTVAATSGTVAASAEGTVELQKKPPTPVTTKISLSVPDLVIWPNGFNANVRVTGKGNYACTISFQDYYLNFNVAAGSSKTVRVQPTMGVNLAQRVSVSCRSSYSSGFASDWLILSLQR